MALQRLTTERNAGFAGARRMEWRIGIHLGDVLVEGDDILGDGVNIAARLEEARAIIARLRTVSPVVVPELSQFRNQEHRELFLSGLRLAAGETT